MHWFAFNDAVLDVLFNLLRLQQPSTLKYPPGSVMELTVCLALLMVDCALLWMLGRALYRLLFPRTVPAPGTKRRWHALAGPMRGLALAALPLLILEGALRLYVAHQPQPTYLPHPLYLWHFPADANLSYRTPVGPMIFHTNSMGLRDEELPLAKTPHEVRIVCLGDSATFGQSVPLEQCYEKVLQRMLQEKYPDRKWTVIDCGQPGYSMLQGYYFFLNVAIRYHPDLVIVNEFNEFSDRQMAQFATDIPRNALVRALKVLMWRSMLYLTLRKEAMRFFPAPPAPAASPRDSDIPILSMDETSYFIKQFIALFRARHMHAVFALWRRPAVWAPYYARLLQGVPLRDGIVYEDYNFRLLKRNPGRFWIPHDPSHHPSAGGHAMMARCLLDTIEANHLLGSTADR